MNFKYILGGLISLPLLPVMFVQGKRIKATVPSLPEANGHSGVTENATSTPFKLITIGESTIAGVGVDTHEEGFTGALSRGLSDYLKKPVEWRVYAKSGYTVQKVTEEIIPTIEEESIDLIVIGMGGNDAFELNSPNKWMRDIHDMIKSLKERFGDTPIVFTNMPPIKDFPAFTSLIKFVIGNLVGLFGEELNKVCKQYSNVYFASDQLRLADWIGKLDQAYTPDDFFSDGVHPSKLTYQTWGKEVARFAVQHAINDQPLAAQTNLQRNLMKNSLSD